jgi:bacillithiol biosynthesis cysteine-adding enzyme BshC
MPERAAQLLDYASFATPPNALLRDYLADEPRARAFFVDGFDMRALVSAARRTLATPRACSAIARALAVAQQAHGATRAAARAIELEQPRAVAVVSGQQACLFGGPLLVLYKALAVLALAERLAAEHDGPVVPIFWVASTDHDFTEIRSLSVCEAAGSPHELRYAPHVEPVGQPAARIVIDDTIAGLVDAFAAAGPPSASREAAVAGLRNAYQPGRSLSEAFARLLSAYLPDLVMLDASDPMLAQHAVPILEREISEGSPTSRLAEATAARLVTAGYDLQVPVRAGFLNLFVYAEGQRRALALREGGMEVRGTNITFPIERAIAHLRQNPTDWSPNALLRPLVQDHVLPVAAYVGGPAEIAYHAEIGDGYAAFGIPRPVLVPRPSLTLVEPAQARFLDSEGLPLPSLQGEVDKILGAWARESHPEIEQAFARARESVRTALKDVATALGSLDPTLAAACDAAVGRTLHPIDGLHEKAERALKRRDAAHGDRARRAHDALFPGGAFQERVCGWIELVARHGPPVLDWLRAEVDVLARGHQVLYL